MAALYVRDPRLHYLPIQKVLHWIVVLGVLAQWYTSDAIHRTHNTFVPATAADHLQHALHNYLGITLGFVIAARLLLRILNPVASVVARPAWQHIAAETVHWGLYASLLAPIAAGFVTAYLWSGAGRLHVLFWNLTLLLIALHLVAVVLHLVGRDGVVTRMLPKAHCNHLR